MRQRQPRIAFFGHFDGSNFGNESTFQATLDRLRSVLPDASFSCICTGPVATAASYDIDTISIRDVSRTWKTPTTRISALARLLFVGIPNEMYRWIRGFQYLWGTDALIVPGTGLLSDAYGLLNWGPYDMFRWTMTAKMCGCKLLFVSMGAGPLYSRLGRFFVKTALSASDFRSYRDVSTQQYLGRVGFASGEDPVYPDLAFSLGEPVKQEHRLLDQGMPVVGIGLMEYAGKYSVEKPTAAISSAYLRTIVEFVQWLLTQGYAVRLLSGDKIDADVMQEFRRLLKQAGLYDPERIFYEPVQTAAHLLRQLAATDFVVATRFHNILLSFLLNRPAIAISFHHKCSSLMKQMGMDEYCEDINTFTKDHLMATFCQLRENESQIKQTIKAKVKACQDALDEQYDLILRTMCPDERQLMSQSRVPPSKPSRRAVS